MMDTLAVVLGLKSRTRTLSRMCLREDVDIVIDLKMLSGAFGSLIVYVLLERGVRRFCAECLSGYVASNVYPISCELVGISECRYAAELM